MASLPTFLDPKTQRPLILDPRRTPAPLPVPDGMPGLGASVGMGTGAAPSLPSLYPSNVTAMPTPPTPLQQQTQRTQSQLGLDQNALSYKARSGSGVDQIAHPVDADGNPTGQPIGLARRGLSVLGHIGDTALSILSPGIAALTPGTTLHHNLLMNQDRGRINNDLKDQQEEAQTTQTGALTNYTLQRPEIEQSKIDQKQTAVQERVGQAAAARGQKVSWDANGLPSFEDDHDSQAFKDHQALSAMHQSTSDKNAIMADIAKNHYIPGTPEFAEAQRKLSQVDKRLGVAMQSLGLRAKGLELRAENQQATNYNTDMAGNPLPGAPQIDDGEGNMTTVGSRNAARAISQQKSVGSFNDLGGSVTHARGALQKFYSEGGSLSDPTIVAAMSDPGSTIGKVINGKFIQPSLSPTAIAAINAVRQLHEQAGILRSTTGGTASEAGAQRILEVVPSPGDSNEVALNKLNEQEQVLSRLAPGQTHVAGGLAVRHPGGTPNRAPQSFKQTATGPGGHKIGSNDGVNWTDMQTGKAVQ